MSQPDKEVTRSYTLTRSAVNAEDRTVSLSFSSESPVKDFPFEPPVVFLHEEGAAELESWREQGSVLLNHDVNQIVGAPVKVELDQRARKGRAVVRFDTDEEGDKAFLKVKSGSLRGVSARFLAPFDGIQRLEEGDEWTSPQGRRFRGPLLVATRWELKEVSLTPIPADAAVGVGRSQRQTKKEPDMAQTEKKVTADIREFLVSRGMQPGATDDEALEFMRTLVIPGKTEAKAETPAEAIERHKKDAAKDKDPVAAVEVERHRCTELKKIQEKSGMPAYELAGWIENGTSLESAREIAMEFMSVRQGNVTRPGSMVEVVLSEREKFFTAMNAHVLRRARGYLNGQPKSWEFNEKACEDVPRDLHIIEVARQMLVRAGNRDANKWDRSMVAMRALQHGTSDFPSLLENVINKSLGVGYAEAPTTWQAWAGTGSLSDFKAATRVAVGDTDAFEEVKELMPITEATMSEKKESRQLSTFAKRFGVSRQALINDDLGEFSRIPQKHGSAAARTINEKVYAQITSPPTMAEDSIALFSASHPSGSNLTTGAGAPSITTLGTLLALMRKQKGVGLKARTNLQPRFILGPVALETTIRQLVQGTLTPAQTSNVVLPWMMQLTPVVDPILDDTSAVAWFLIAGSNDIDTLRVEFLNGQQTPQIISLDGSAILGREWIAYIDFSVKVFDHRGFQKHAGA